ncbi:MAG: alpha-D-ribose 1-methylphosphonate 5-triphosphate diphosphatase [Pseudomonadota bacterium]
MTTETIWTNARLVLSDEIVRGTIAFGCGGITGILPGRSKLPGAIDVEGDFVVPGLVELHTDNVERHLNPRPNSYWPAHAALLNHDREIASAGITTVFNALSIGHADSASRDFGRLQETCAALSACKDSKLLKADHFLHLRCEVSCPDLPELVDPLLDHPLAMLLSVMDHTPGQRQFATMEAYRAYYMKKYQMSDEEFQVYASERIEFQKRYSAPNRKAIVSKAHKRAIQIASHDDATLNHVDEAVEDRVSIAEFPTTSAAAKASHDAGMAVLMGGPNVVRGKSHNGNASARDFAEQGWLDIISSDYVPASLLYASFVLSECVERIDLPKAVRMVTAQPAKSAGLNDRGRLEEGLRADLVRFHDVEGTPVIREVRRKGQRIA